jgi:hypothetical protein
MRFTSRWSCTPLLHEPGHRARPHGPDAVLGPRRPPHVGGQGWARPNKDPWFHFAIHQVQADDAVRPWETLCWLNDLAYTGHPDEPADGHAYACPSGYQFQNRRLRSVGAHGRIDVLTLVLAADGTPVAMHLEGEHPSLAGRATPFTLDARFTDVGGPITIKAP